MFEPYVIELFIRMLDSDSRSIDRDIVAIDRAVRGGYATKGEEEELKDLQALAQLIVIVRGFVKGLEKED